MFKTILALALVASAYLLTSDAKAQGVDMREPTAICSDAGSCVTVSPPSTWTWDRNGFTYFRLDGMQDAVACATPQVRHMWNGRYWDRAFVANGTVGRAINDHVCATVAQLTRTTNRTTY